MKGSSHEKEGVTRIRKAIRYISICLRVNDSTRFHLARSGRVGAAGRLRLAIDLRCGGGDPLSEKGILEMRTLGRDELLLELTDPWENRAGKAHIRANLSLIDGVGGSSLDR